MCKESKSISALDTTRIIEAYLADLISEIQFAKDGPEQFTQTGLKTHEADTATFMNELFELLDRR